MPNPTNPVVQYRHGVKVGPGTRAQGSQDLRSWDPEHPSEFKSGTQNPLKFKNGTSGPHSKFESGILGSPSKCKNWTHIMVVLLCYTYYTLISFILNSSTIFLKTLSYLFFSPFHTRCA